MQLIVFIPVCENSKNNDLTKSRNHGILHTINRVGANLKMKAPGQSGQINIWNLF